jgi:CheY-like chemotaxis protein
MPTSPRSAVILVVEDDENDVLFLQRAFQKVGVRQELQVARDGQEAIDYLSGVGRFQNRQEYPVPCLVILDLKLPKKNGLEVLAWLRQQEDLADMPVVMVTSSDQDHDLKRASAHGVEAYRVKPVSFEELVRLAGEIREEAEDHCKDAAPCPPKTPQR